MISDSSTPRSVVFDLDGTLADTSVDLLSAANAAFDAQGLAQPLDTISDASVAFHGGRKMVALGMARLSLEDAGLAEGLYQSLLRQYAQNICVETKLYPGAEAALQRLEARGDVLSVCTNKPIAMAQVLLQKLGIAPYFKAVLGGDSLPIRKPDPEHLRATLVAAGGPMDRAVLIGDTFNDSVAAAKAGVASILVTFGPEGAGVSRLNPDALLDHYDALPDVIDQLLP